MADERGPEDEDVEQNDVYRLLERRCVRVSVAVQFMNSLLLAEQLRRKHVISTFEYRELMDYGKKRSMQHANRHLLMCVNVQTCDKQKTFVDILLQKQPHLVDAPEDYLRNLARQESGMSETDFEAAHLVNSRQNSEELVAVDTPLQVTEGDHEGSPRTRATPSEGSRSTGLRRSFSTSFDSDDDLSSDSTSGEDEPTGEPTGIFISLAARSISEKDAAHFMKAFPLIEYLLDEHILTTDEYLKLVRIDQLQPWHYTNRELLFVMGRKMHEQQELFAELLLQQQPHLTMATRKQRKHLARQDAAASYRREWSSGSGQASSKRLRKEDLSDFKEQLRRWFARLTQVKPLDYLSISEEKPIEEVYVTLSSISYEEALDRLLGMKHRQTQLRQMAQGPASRLPGTPANLADLHTLLQRNAQNQLTGRSLVLGGGGSGKSLTCYKILAEWSGDDPSPFKEFDAVFYITGREQKRLSAKSRAQLLRFNSMSFDKERARQLVEYFTEHSEKMLFLIDGGDELSNGGLLDQGLAVRRVLRGQLFPKACVIITSRPCPGAYKLLNVCQRHFALVGFTDDNLHHLIKCRLGQQQAAQLLRELALSSNLHTKAIMKGTPLVAAMVTQLFKVGSALPASVTVLYETMLLQVCHRFTDKLKQAFSGSPEGVFSSYSADETIDLEKSVAELGQLAVEGILHGKLTFRSEDLQSCGRPARDLGLLTELKFVGVSMRRDDRLFHFHHLTWQEFLAARSIARDPDVVSMIKLCIEAIGVEENTWLFWRFFAGLIHPHLLPDVIFSLSEACGLSGNRPWETKTRLFLLGCLVEVVRVSLAYSNPLPSCCLELAAQLIFPAGRIVISGCVLDLSDISVLTEVAKRCPHLFHFLLDTCSLADLQSCQLAEGLVHADVIELSQVSGIGVEPLLDSMSDKLSTPKARLEMLNCGSFKIEQKEASYLGKLISKTRSLRCLVLKGCELRAAGVNQLCRKIKSRACLSELKLVNDNLAGSGETLQLALSQLPNLQRLMLSKCELDNDDVAKVLQGLGSTLGLLEVHLQNNRLSDDLVAELVEFAFVRSQQQEQLELVRSSLARLMVYLGGTDVSDECLQILPHTLPPNSKLTVNNDQMIADSDGVRHVDHAVYFHKVGKSVVNGHVRYSSPGMKDSGAAQVASVLGAVEGMKSLDMPASHIGNTGCAHLASALKSSRLHALDLQGNIIGTAGFISILTALSQSRNLLRYLNVGDNPVFAHISAEEGQTIFELLPQLVDIQILGLSNTKMDDEVLVEHGLTFVFLRRLVVLDLSCNEIGDAGAGAIAEDLQFARFLQHLLLSGNKITDAGAKMLTDEVKSLSNRQESVSRIECMWLGSNENISPTFFSDCQCELVSSGSFGLVCSNPEYILHTFPDVKRHQHRQDAGRGSPKTTQFWQDVNTALRQEPYFNLLGLFMSRAENDSFDRWLTRGFVSLQSANEHMLEKRAKYLLKLFDKLCEWYAVMERNSTMATIVSCYYLCVANELTVGHSLPLQHHTRSILDRLAGLCSSSRNLMAVCFSCLQSLTERSQQLGLVDVAHLLAEQAEQLALQLNQPPAHTNLM